MFPVIISVANIHDPLQKLHFTLMYFVAKNSLDLTPLSPDFAYGRPSISSGTSMINGVISRNTTHSYIHSLVYMKIILECSCTYNLL